MHATELQELSVMTEPAQVASFGQDGRCVDRADAWNGGQRLIVGQVRQQLDGPSLDQIALTDEAAPFSKNKVEHPHRVRIGMNWQANRVDCSGLKRLKAVALSTPFGQRHPRHRR
jgi:hypothetical protein